MTTELPINMISNELPIDLIDAVDKCFDIFNNNAEKINQKFCELDEAIERLDDLIAALQQRVEKLNESLEAVLVRPAR